MGMTDLWLAGLAEDIAIFDGNKTLIIVHFEGTAELNFSAGTAEQSQTRTQVEDCLVRQAASRDAGTVSNIRERMAAVQKDLMGKVDVVIEVPLIGGLIITVGDQIEDPVSGEVWIVNGVDYSTLRTRYRLGANKYGSLSNT